MTMDDDQVPMASAEFLAGNPSDTSEHFPVKVLNAGAKLDTSTAALDDDESTIRVAATRAPFDTLDTEGVRRSADDRHTRSENADTDTIAEFRKRRKRRQKIAFVSGFVVGLIICGPIVGLVGGATAHYIVKRRGRQKQAEMMESALKGTDKSAEVSAPVVSTVEVH